MANTDKMITETVLKDATEKILQTIADKIYDLVPYDSTEISEILEISDEEAMELVKILNDNIISNNKLWSSNKTNTEIQNAIIEANKYAYELIGQISSISLEYVTTLPTSDIKSNVIYILQGTPNTLNVYNTSTSTFVSVGDLDLDLSQYYTKTEVDSLLTDKADDNTVVHQDDVVTDMTTTSGTTVLSTSGLKTELDKKANDDEVVKTADIATSIDSTSTDTQVPSAKATWDSLYKICDTQVLVDANNPTSKICMADLTTLNTPSKEGITSAESSLIISIEGRDYWNGQLSISMAESEVYVRSVRDAGTWTKWRKLCTTSVEDVPVTTLTVNSWASGTITYCVRNGICFVHVTALISNTMSTTNQELASGLPKPLFADKWYSVASNTPTQGSLFVHLDVNGKLTNHVGIDNSYYFGSFSYVVAES